MPADAVAAYRGSTRNCSSMNPLHEPLNKQPETIKTLANRNPPANLHSRETQGIEEVPGLSLSPEVSPTLPLSSNAARSKKGRKATALYFSQTAAANSTPAPASFSFTPRPCPA